MWAHMTLPWRGVSLQKTILVFYGKCQVIGSLQPCLHIPRAPTKLNASHDPPSHDIPPYDQECNQPCEDG